MMNSYDIKKDFPLLEKNQISYLDSGATSQKPQIVLDAIKNFYEKSNANPHRGAYSLSMDATSIYEETREKIAKFIHAKHPEEIIFSKNHINSGIYEALGTEDQSVGMQRIYSAVRMADSQGLLQEGANQMIINVEGYQVGIRVYIDNGIVRNLDAFTVWPGANINGYPNTFFYNGVNPWQK